MKLLAMKRLVACSSWLSPWLPSCPPTPTNGRRPTTSPASPICGSKLPTPISASPPGTRTRSKPRSSPTRYKIGEGGIRVEEHQTGDSVEIDVRYPHHDFTIEWGHHRVDIIIQMPREGHVNLRTGDGKIDIAGLKGEMDLHSGDGSENLEAVDGKLHASTGDGHITAHGRFDELELKTGDGHLDVRADGGSSLAAGWRLETGDGNVSLEVPGGLAADVDLHTSDGHIDLDMPVTTEGKVRQNEVRGKLNGGGSLLTIRTGDGSIHLRKG